MKLQALIFTLILAHTSLTWGSFNCPGLSIGTDIGQVNVVNQGTLDPLWDSSKHVRKVVRRDSEYFYITSNTHKLNVSCFKMTQNLNSDSLEVSN